MYKFFYSKTYYAMGLYNKYLYMNLCKRSNWYTERSDQSVLWHINQCAGLLTLSGVNSTHIDNDWGYGLIAQTLPCLNSIWNQTCSICSFTLIVSNWIFCNANISYEHVTTVISSLSELHCEISDVSGVESKWSTTVTVICTSPSHSSSHAVLPHRTWAKIEVAHWCPHQTYHCLVFIIQVSYLIDNKEAFHFNAYWVEQNIKNCFLPPPSKKKA